MRHDNRSGNLYLNHDFGEGDNLEEYLKNFRNSFIVFNIKEAGIEQRCIDLTAKFGVPKSNYFLLDVEFPYLYQASRQKQVREIAVRYSETEPIETAIAQKKFVDWVWIDTNTKLPLNENIVKSLEGFKTCLVAPDRWGRPEDSAVYRKIIEKLKFPLNAVMTGIDYADLWS